MLLTAVHRLFKNQQLQQHTYGTAVALAERSAEFVSFQWHYASFPPRKNVISADTADRAAVQFSGSIAICAVFAAINAIFATNDQNRADL